MWLEKLVVINYRSCQFVEYCLSKDDPNILIGINDCGKSSILQAVGLLLSLKPKFAFGSELSRKSDFSNSPISKDQLKINLDKLELPMPDYDERQSVVIGKVVFEDSDKAENAVKSYSNHLQFAIDHQPTGSIWLARVFNLESADHKDYLLTSDIVNNGRPITLFNEPAKNLQELVKSSGISKQDIENNNRAGRYKNSELVEALYKDKQLTSVWAEYQIKSDFDAFPKYEYLDWNISMQALQKFAGDIVAEKIGEHIRAAADYAKDKAAEAQHILDMAFGEFTENFASDLPNVEAFKASIAMEVDTKVTDILVNKRNCDGDIHLDSQGDGVKRQIWFALIKWVAAQTAVDGGERKKFIWCFDEPETHLYPRAQRELFQIIKNVALQHTQVVISTHSTIFIDRADFRQISRFELNDGYYNYSTCENVSEVYDALHIRNSDFLFYDAFLVVEGETEAVLLPHLFEAHSGKKMAEMGIQLIKLNGKDNRHQHRLIFDEMLRNFNKPLDSVVYLFDRDIKFEMTASEIDTYTYFTLGKQDIEDSISPEIWEQFIGEKFKDLQITISAEEFSIIQEAIPIDTAAESSQKFYARLKAELIRKVGAERHFLVNDRLPEKGASLGKSLCSLIDSLDHIDSNVKTAFDKLIA
jgi:putative ATP-dependent endonuclease of the OLD family